VNKVIFTDNNDPVLAAYLKEISKYPMFPQEEIGPMVVTAQNGDEEARDTVVKAHLRFVITIAKKWQGRGVPLMDLISEGNRGLLYAITKFDINKGVPFINYAVHWIKQYIYQSIYWTGKEIRLPVSQHLKVIQILKASSQFAKENERNASAPEIAELAGVDESDVHYLAQFANKPLSLDNFLGGDSDNNQLSDVISDGAPLLDEVTDREFLYNELKSLVSQLPNREHDVICLLFGIDRPPMENHLVGDLYGVGVERIRQIKENALKKLKKQVKKKFKDYV
jgi:RNA polymerase primary sigma factor